MQNPYSNISSGEEKHAQNRTIFFPNWVECPYNFYVRLTWACAMDLARRDKLITCVTMADITGVSDKTIRRAIRCLAKDNLCTRPQRCRYPNIELIEPAADARYWASKSTEVKRTNDADCWLSSYSYTVVAIDRQLGSIQSVLLGKVARLHGKQSYAGLAVMLGLERKTVKRALAGLAGRKRIAVTQLDDGYIVIKLLIDASATDTGQLITGTPALYTDLESTPQSVDNPCQSVDNPPQSVDNPCQSVDREGSIMGIIGIKELIEEKGVSLKEEKAERERGLRAINEKLLTLRCAKETRIKVMKLVDRLFSRTTESCYHGQFNSRSRYACEDVSQWFERYYTGLAEDHKKRNYTGKAISLVIHRLEIAAGVKPEPTPVAQLRRVLSEDEQYAIACEREFQARLREDRELGMDFSIPNVSESRSWSYTSAV